MKYFALLVCALIVSSSANAQSLVLTSFQQEFNVKPDGNWLDFHMGVRNTSLAMVPTRVRMDVSQMLRGHRAKFCFAENCYDEGTLVSAKNGGTSFIASGSEDASTFLGEFRADSTEGVTLLPFTFFNDNKESDNVQVTLRFTVALQASVADNDNSASFSANPMPANDVLQLNLPNPSASVRTLRIVNVQGQEVHSMEFNADSMTFNSSALPSGCYAAIVRSSDGTFAQIRFVIAH